MINVIREGIIHYCLPSCACCKFCHKLIGNVDKCPEDGGDECNPDCAYYDEIWDENELKEELDQDEDKLTEGMNA